MHTVTFYKALAGGLTALLLLLAGLTAALVLEAKRELDHFRDQEAELRRQLAQVQLDLQKKQEYLWRLENDDEFLERIARQRLGYARPDELIYRFDVDPLTAQPLPGAPPNRQAAPNRGDAARRPTAPRNSTPPRNGATPVRRN